ncbi:uncharacterized protein LOC100569660 [Acyrthosiphon pisum]|uniref:Uncharacterized protein n=1 Tax=Acyrthosiphon pisum TaxID=7029 RepID=A0A8R1W871_ACYPI|nr:uncharacterized protein LOC100569660 [Acyrthosiphon pisum]|eukprot:XP_003244183.1 PREDICTED: uncharacterized protein LOC100569660 [Acyrthosiphon pisum]
MAKPKTKNIKYAQRLKELKEKLKPYRNRQTVNLLRVITGSSSRFLHKYWESLESVLTGQYSPQVVIQRIQSVVNMILENGECTVRAAHSKSIEHSMVSGQFMHIHIDSKANVSDNVTHVETVSKANEVDNVRHVETVSKANEVDNVRHVNIDSRSSMFAKDDVLGNETHGNINSNSNVFDNANVTNRLRHLHIKSCNPACYNRL